MKDIVIKNVTKSYGDKIILDSLNAVFKNGRVTCVLGGSGSGKTTLLNVIAGITSYQGECDREGLVSYIFQTPRLIETATVKKNLEYVLTGVYSKEEISEKIDSMLKTLDMEDKKLSYPSQLSGGEAQRISMGRAFLYPSETMLMDEPFGALDVKLKYKLSKEFSSLLKKSAKTVIFVTHDIDEALMLGDDFYVLKDGKFVESFSIDMDREGRQIGDKTLNDLRSKIFKSLTE